MKPRSSYPLLVASFAAAVTLVGGHGATVAQSNGDLIAVTSGTLPIIITAPHGGRDAIPGVAERQRGTRVRDEATDEIARGVALELEKVLHSKPSLVVARFHRKYLDANRSEAEAFDDPRARPVYQAYHAAIRSLVAAARTASPGRALLVDIHGQAKEPDALVRGTRDGKTVKRLLAREGEAALAGPKSIFGALAAAGYRVVPAVDAKTKESPSYDGGFTVATYGSHEPDGIDALQIEIGADLRKDPAKRTKLEHDLAGAIAAFYRAYLAR